MRCHAVPTLKKLCSCTVRCDKPAAGAQGMDEMIIPSREWRDFIVESSLERLS